MKSTDIAGAAAELDSLLDGLEELARKLQETQTKFVLREKTEIEFLLLIENARDVLQDVVKNDDRNFLIAVMGSPYTRLARIKYMLDCTSLSEKRVSDPRWTDLQQSCEVIEAVLRDLDGKKFKAWQDLLDEGLFMPAFEDPDKMSRNGSEDEKEEEKKEQDETNQVLEEKALDSCPSGESKLEDEKKQRTQTFTAPQFLREPAGRSAHVLRGGSILTRLADREDQNALASLVDQCASTARGAGYSTEVGRTLHYYSRKVLTSFSDSGCTGMSDLPILKFDGLGQYAEVTIQAVREESPLGCFGIGVTTLPPQHWKKSSLGSDFPKRLDKFPAPSWIFSGPYRGTTRRLYVDGQTMTKYNVEEGRSRWKNGDKVGLLVRLDGRMAMYVNGEELTCLTCPGLEQLAESGDLYLVCEAYGYVMGISMAPEIDPSKLPIKKEMVKQVHGPLFSRLSLFVTDLNVPKQLQASMKEARRASLAQAPFPEAIQEEEEQK